MLALNLKKMLSDDFEKRCEEQNQANIWDRGITKRGNGGAKDLEAEASLLDE